MPLPELTGKYKHYCYDWDGLEIDETCPEFSCCTCYDKNEEIEKIQEELTKEFWEMKFK